MEKNFKILEDKFAKLLGRDIAQIFIDTVIIKLLILVWAILFLVTGIINTHLGLIVFVLCIVDIIPKLRVLLYKALM